MLVIPQEPTGGAFSVGEVWGGIAAFLVLSGGLFAAWRALSKQIEDFRDKDLKELGKRTERVETRLGERITRVETRLTDALREFMRDVKTALVRAPSPVDRSESPIRLTDLGQAISTELNASDWADRTAAVVSVEVEGNEPYEIQDFCFRYVATHEYPNDEQREIRRAAYQHGLPVEQVLRVLAIELRDKLLTIADLEAPE